MRHTKPSGANVRLVVDLNVLISGALWPGASAFVLRAAEEGRVTLLASDRMLDTLQGVLVRPKFAKVLSPGAEGVARVEDRIRSLVEVVIPAEVDAPGLRDRDDLAILECAVGGGADLIVSGDKDLLTLRSFAEIGIVSPATARRMFPDVSTVR